MKLLAVGGGSGGHVTPVLAVVNQLAKLDSTLDVEFICDRAFESQARGLMKHADAPVRVRVIAAGKFRRYTHLTFWQHFTVPSVVFGNIGDIGKIIKGFFQSFFILLRVRPDVVFAKGGYVCLPVGLAAWLLRIPLVIHDSDARPGLTNRILSRFATSIATGLPLENYTYPLKKSHYVGVPISPEFAPVDSNEQKRMKQELGFDDEEFLVVGVGGGLGATPINTALVRAASQLASEHINLYVVTGKSHYHAVQAASSNIPNFRATPFVFEDMVRVLGAADVVISRASATFIQELAGIKKPVIMVPARQLGDQIKNADVYAKADAAIVLSDKMLLDDESDELVATIRSLHHNKEKRDELAANLHAFARPYAVRDVASLIMQASEKP